ncbi:MAG: hypothetical protein J6D09_04330 [Clostridia bacterium]|nr:hypothetical protein [Clostridia bacterium]
MKYVSLSKNKYAALFATLFSALTVVFIFLSTLGLLFRGIFEAFALAGAVTVIQIVQRYLMTYYEYILDPADELLTYNRLTVIQVVGKRRTSVYTVPLANLSAVIPYKKMKTVEKEYGKVGKKMSFCPDMFPKESCLLIFEDGNELTLLRLQCGGDFMSAIEERRGV